jgi:cyclopropane fatty-acyl-phospholipid synthase-like methyltransferase
MKSGKHARSAKQPQAHETLQHFIALQDFYESIFGDCNIHFPLWFPDTKNAAMGVANSNRLLADTCKVRRGQIVLDAGCGLGGSAFWLAENRGVEVVAISPVEPNIKRCRQLAALRQLDHLIQFQVVDFMSEPFQSDTFDAVWNIESFIYAFPKESYIRNTYRILKPGGTWACLDAFIPGDLGPNSAPETLLSRINKGFALTDAHWESLSQVRLNMRHTGFCKIHWKDLTSYLLGAPRWPYAFALARSLLNGKDLLAHPELYRLRLNAFVATYAIFRLMQRKAIAYGLLVGQKPASRAT